LRGRVLVCTCISLLLVVLLTACGDEQAVTSTEETQVVPKRDLAATIRAAATTESSGRHILAVDCVSPVDTAEVILITCAVTFRGPACQLWLASGADDSEPAAFGEPTEGRRGRVDDRMAYCE
jgi:hypothetical protein